MSMQYQQSGSVIHNGLGILGGGQLGRMLALAAADLGIKVKFLDPMGEAAPAAVAAFAVKGSFRDANAIEAFAKTVDVLTVEIEHVNSAILKELQTSVDIQPSPQTISIIQDKYAQKQHFKNAGIALGDFCDVPDQAALFNAANDYGYPFMLKSKRLAYDGKGNFVVHNEQELEIAVNKLGGFEHGLYAEKWQSFVRELAVMVVRSQDGTTKLYPVTETVQKNNICYVTETPAQISIPVKTAAEALAVKSVSALDGAGVFGVEMFLLPDGSVLLNEVAPRVHNSGHYTIDGCVTSQFENHIRAILDLPLGDTSLKTGHVIMLNIIGEADGEIGQQIADDLISKALNIPGCSVHWYDKNGVTKGRKLGHINIVANTIEEARVRLGMLDSKALASLTSKPHAKVGIIMGSDSDLQTMKDAAAILEELGVECEVTIVSAHRTPERLAEYARSAYERGIRVIVAGAGGAAHLPGMVAAQTSLPVVGVPVVPNSAVYKDGFDALLSIVQMPAGIPVATVAIGNGRNGGLLAARLLAASDPILYQKLLSYQEKMRNEVLAKAEKLEASGWKDYNSPSAASSKKATEFLPQFAAVAPKIEPTDHVAIAERRTQGYVSQIHAAINHTLDASDLDLVPYNKGNPVDTYIGKVRDRYHLNDEVVLVTSDRLTAFDRSVANIPFKGAVLNLISEYWFKQTAGIMQNHLIAVPHPNTMIAKAVTPFKVELVVREYLTGSSATSIWTLYQQGEREFGGLTLPDGMKQHQKLPRAIITPTSKSDEHDEPLTPEQIVANGLMTKEQWEYCSAKALELFAFARDNAAKRGFILVDTKMEMGIDANGNIILIDELFTPDSSRYWIASSYDSEAIARGDSKTAPKNIDKEFIRLWLKDNCDPYKDQLPKVPEDKIVELSRRYILLYEVITGQQFPFEQVLGASDVAKAIANSLTHNMPRLVM